MRHGEVVVLVPGSIYVTKIHDVVLHLSILLIMNVQHNDPIGVVKNRDVFWSEEGTGKHRTVVIELRTVVFVPVPQLMQ